MEHDNENHLEGLGRLIAQAEVDSEDDAHEEEEDGNRVLFLDEMKMKTRTKRRT